VYCVYFYDTARVRTSPTKISSWLHEQSWTVHECSWTFLKCSWSVHHFSSWTNIHECSWTKFMNTSWTLMNHILEVHEHTDEILWTILTSFKSWKIWLMNKVLWCTSKKLLKNVYWNFYIIIFIKKSWYKLLTILLNTKKCKYCFHFLIW
jgi:hypothetical protein